MPFSVSYLKFIEFNHVISQLETNCNIWAPTNLQLVTGNISHPECVAVFGGMHDCVGCLYMKRQPHWWPWRRTMQTTESSVPAEISRVAVRLRPFWAERPAVWFAQAEVQFTLAGIQLSRTTPHHPAANGLVEYFHRTLKAAIMCHADQQWTEALPLVLLGIRTAFKEDLQASVAELVYGEPLRIPGELLTPTAHPVDSAHLITELRQHMACRRPVPATRHASPATFVHSDLKKCTHVFLRQDSTRRALEPPYSGPYKGLSRREKTLQLLVRGKPVTVSKDRVKPAYILNKTDRRNNSNQPTAATLAIAPPATPPQPPTTTTRSGRHVHFPARFTLWATVSAGGWCGNLPQSE
jgi:hypothetical protein